MKVEANNLLEKYDVPTPRYTSYPTVPCWQTEKFSWGEWMKTAKRTFDQTNRQQGISLYLHLPFCESLCTYCACTTRITRNHLVELPYIEALLKEWQHYRTLFATAPLIREIHLGGGTPTFFDPGNLRDLIAGLLSDSVIADEFCFSFEGHPNNTTAEHLQVLHEIGFKRVSFGVQDLDEKVQVAIHRVQPYENLARATALAREIGYTSVSYDLVYGLPFQTLATVEKTLKKVIELRPDRLAFYSYAHVPWLKPGQRGYSEADLPMGELKRQLYEFGRDSLLAAGYKDIGMDHFALPGDELYKAYSEGRLHRNFMGYTTSHTEMLIGLGASAISDTYLGYAQNEKKVEAYVERIKQQGSAIVKGHLMSREDVLRRECILALSCRGRIEQPLFEQVKTDEILTDLATMESEGIVSLSPDGTIHMTSKGQPFLRNVCGVFDQYLAGVINQQQVFSKAI